VPLGSSLSWSGAAAGVTFDVYFDTVNPPVAKVATGQSAGTFTPILPASLNNYYWRVVANSTNGQTAGPVWSFTTVIPGDVNGDGHVNLTDLLLLAAAWGTHTGDPTFNIACDFNADGAVDVTDLLIMARNWGT
jgi:hypothetical protein